MFWDKMFSQKIDPPPARPCPFVLAPYRQWASIPMVFTIKGHQYQRYLPSLGINTNGIYHQWASIPRVFIPMGIHTNGIHTNRL